MCQRRAMARRLSQQSGAILCRSARPRRQSALLLQHRSSRRQPIRAGHQALRRVLRLNPSITMTCRRSSTRATTRTAMTTRYPIRAGQCRSVGSRSSGHHGAHRSRPHRLPHGQVRVQRRHPPRTLARHAVHRIRAGLCGAVPDCNRRTGRSPRHRLRSSRRPLRRPTCRCRRLHLWRHPSERLGVQRQVQDRQHLSTADKPCLQLWQTRFVCILMNLGSARVCIFEEVCQAQI